MGFGLYNKSVFISRLFTVNGTRSDALNTRSHPITRSRDVNRRETNLRNPSSALVPLDADAKRALILDQLRAEPLKIFRHRWKAICESEESISFFSFIKIPEGRTASLRRDIEFGNPQLGGLKEIRIGN